LESAKTSNSLKAYDLIKPEDLKLDDLMKPHNLMKLDDLMKPHDLMKLDGLMKPYDYHNKCIVALFP
jgi:hypothetical protein